MCTEDVWLCPNCKVKIKDTSVNRVRHINRCIGFKTINKHAGGYQPRPSNDNSDGSPPKKP